MADGTPQSVSALGLDFGSVLGVLAYQMRTTDLVNMM